MRYVKIVQMGPLIPELKLSKVVSMANKSTNIFKFSLGDQIHTVGPPDADGQYKFAGLANTLKECRTEDNPAVLIGIIDSQIYDELYSGVDEDNQCIIISIKDVQTILDRARRNYVDYVLCEIGAQLLALELRRIKNISVDPENCALPWHAETRFCLFDYDENRDDTFKKLMSPKLCANCKAVFTDANMKESVQTACVKIVQAGIKPFKSALKETFQNKIVTGLLGMLLGATIFGNDWSPPISYVTIGIVIVVLYFLWRDWKRQFIKL